MTSQLSIFAARLRETIESGNFSGRSFPESALELFALQCQHNPPYRRFCESRCITPEQVRDWCDIPAMPADAFKELDVTSLPVAQRTAVFHSSGTTEQRPSRHFHSHESLALYETSLLAWFKRQVLSGDVMPARSLENRKGIVALTPPPALAPHSSLVHMFGTIHREFGTADSTFLGQIGSDGAWKTDVRLTVQKLQRFAETRDPVLLLGTAFNFVHLLDHLAEHNLAVRLADGSRVMETGGYKGRSRALPKAELHASLTERLGIPPSEIICEYGMSELGSQAYAHSQLHFHFPPWARAQLVSPETGREVAEGETGLIRIFDLANVFSVMAIQTEDLGVRRGSGFEVIGRAALAEPRGCSLMA